jgi:phosphoserine aminotransferase
MEKYNFNAGPCVLPRPAVESAIEAIRNFDNTGIGILEISHRTPGWERIMKETADLWKELLNIPDNYHVLFLGGGASTQFFDVPANLLKSKAAYLETGSWAKKAIKEAKFYGEVEVVASSADKNFSYIPKGYSIPEDVDYFHITSNNTIYGTEIHEDIDSPVTLVADMSSDIMSRPVDVSKYGIIYGGAQKNVGPAGVSFVIVREDILGKTGRPIQTMVDYRTHISDSEKNRSMFNTPPVFSIFVMHETLKWLKEQGGVEAIYKLNKEKAGMLYDDFI